MTKEEALTIARLAAHSLATIFEWPDKHLPRWLLSPFLFEDDEESPGTAKLFFFFLAELLEHSTEFETIVITPTFIWDKSLKQLHTTSSVVYFGVADAARKFLNFYLSHKTKVLIFYQDGSFSEVEFSDDRVIHLQRLLIVHTSAILEWPLICNDSKILQLIKRDFQTFDQVFSAFAFARNEGERRLMLLLISLFQVPEAGAELTDKGFAPLKEMVLADVYRHIEYKLRAMELLANFQQALTVQLDIAHRVFCSSALRNRAIWDICFEPGQVRQAVSKAMDLWSKPDLIFEGGYSRLLGAAQNKMLRSKEEQLLLLSRIELTTGLSFEQVSPKVSQEIDDWLSSNS